MNRRDFLIATSVVTLALPIAAHAAAVDYSPELLAAEMAAGKVVFLDFKASWCSTCAAQERTINALIEENPAYAESITFINVDWDLWGEGDLAKSLNIPRRSTLVVLKSDKELGRIVAGTDKAEIKGLMDLALASA